MSLKKQLRFQWMFLIAMGFLYPGMKILGQTQTVNIEQIQGANGVTLGKINAITQDKLGFMWFSDQVNASIVRYDGSYMKRYQHDPKNPNSLGGYYPECLYADGSGIIWIGFYGQGLDRFDPLTDTFTHYSHDPKDPKSLAHDYVSAVLVDHLGNVWVGTNGGLDLLDQETGTFKHFSLQANDSTSLSCDTVRALYEDKSGTIWVGTGFAYDQIDEGGLNRFDRNTESFTRFLHDPDDPQSLIDNKVRAIFEDSKGNFWVGTKGDGLHSMDRKTGLFTRHTYDPSRPQKLSRPPLNSPFDHITFIVEDAEANLWIGTQAGGINRYDLAVKTLTHFGKNSDNDPTLTDNSGWCAFTTKEGLVWLNTEQVPKLYKIDLFTNTIPIYTDTGTVNCFYEESSSLHWLGTNNGLIRQDLEKGTSRKFLHQPGNPNSLSNNYVNRIIKDHLGYFWISTTNGLNSMDPNTYLFKQYLSDPNDSKSISFGDVYAICEDRDFNIWIGTLGGGLNLLDRETGAFKHYSHNSTDITTIGSDIVSALWLDEEDNLWVGSDSNGGVSKLNRQTETFDRYLSGISINDIFEDANGILWLGTANDLYRYDKESDGFVSTNFNFNITSIVGDNDNNLWIYNALGLMKLDRKREHSILFDEKNGVKGIMNFFGGSYKQQDGKLLITSNNGYYAFYPEKIKIPKDTTRLYFTDFELNGKSVIIGEDSPLALPIYNAEKIQLDHTQNVFSIKFTGIDFSNTKDNTLYYMLENYDSYWRNGKAEDPVTYFKVPPGDYTFKIKTANSSSGLWSEKRISVVISPPWYTTWWAYFIYTGLLIVLVYAVHRYQKDRLLKKERERTRVKELAQAKEIEKAYTTLKATQAQLIQSEKMASLGELTAGIAHEIKNPLNFVNNFSEVNKELLAELKEELEKGNTKEVKALMEDVLNNEEKIIFHGKRADSIVRGMLQHSRSSSGVKEPTDLNALCDEYLRLSYHGLRAKDKSFNASMHTDFDKTIDKVNIVPQDIGRVVLNLLTNAFYAVNEKSSYANASNEALAKLEASEDIKYEPTVSISTKKIGDKVEIRVSDNGNGIPNAVKEKIFQPFFTTKPTGQGTGLGLSMSYDIVTKGHQGKLLVESEEGKGTTFIISLPNPKKV